MTDTNIIDTYIKYNNQLVILLSGLHGSGKSKIAHTLANELKLNYINTRDFIDKEKFKEVKLANDETVKIWNEYKWNEIRDSINENKKNGVILCGDVFENLNDIHIDFHIHIKLSKQNIVKKRLEHIKKLSDDEKKLYYTDETETLIINKIIFPHYLDILQKSHINKFINANDFIDNDDYNEKLTDLIFNEIIQFIIQFFKNKNLDKYIIY